MISAWSAKEHPDGDGRQLREVIALCIEWYMSERAKLIREGGWVGPKLRNADSPDGADFFCFLDYCSMWQGVDRTTEQRAALYACHNSPHAFATLAPLTAPPLCPVRRQRSCLGQHGLTLRASAHVRVAHDAPP